MANQSSADFKIVSIGAATWNLRTAGIISIKWYELLRHILGVLRPQHLQRLQQFQLLCFLNCTGNFLGKDCGNKRSNQIVKLIQSINRVRQWWIVSSWLRPFNEQNQLGEISLETWSGIWYARNCSIRRILNCTAASCRVRCLFLEVKRRFDVTNVTAIISIENFIRSQKYPERQKQAKSWSIVVWNKPIRFNHRQGNTSISASNRKNQSLGSIVHRSITWREQYSLKHA